MDEIIMIRIIQILTSISREHMIPLYKHLVSLDISQVSERQKAYISYIIWIIEENYIQEMQIKESA